jgi:hypothetical protein
MTNEEKQLLFKDLSARSPYGVKATTTSNRWSGVYTVSGCKNNRVYLDCPVLDEGDDEWLIESVKPYLRKISSMTEEEKIEFSNIFSKWFDEELFILSEETFLEYALSRINYSISHELFDWLNAHHFDYRGLIEMGLALEAPKGMYN